MILDSSAIVAIVMREPGHDRMLQRMSEAPRVAVGAPTLIAAGIVLSARLNIDARGLLSRLLHEGAIVTLPVTDAHFGVALDAWLRYGKGRHAAALNYGDCLAYATAVVAGEPLLCVGDDFTKTNCELA